VRPNGGPQAFAAVFAQGTLRDRPVSEACGQTCCCALTAFPRAFTRSNISTDGRLVFGALEHEQRRQADDMSDVLRLGRVLKIATSELDRLLGQR